MTKSPYISPMTFRVTPHERRQILADAKTAGMSFGSYARQRLLKEPQTAPTYRRTETKELMKHLIGHIGRVGNNMNQIAFKLNSNQDLAPLDRESHAEGVRALKDMRSLLITHLLHNRPC